MEWKFGPSLPHWCFDVGERNRSETKEWQATTGSMTEQRKKFVGCLPSEPTNIFKSSILQLECRSSKTISSAESVDTLLYRGACIGALLGLLMQCSLFRPWRDDTHSLRSVLSFDLAAICFLFAISRKPGKRPAQALAAFKIFILIVISILWILASIKPECVPRTSTSEASLLWPKEKKLNSGAYSNDAKTAWIVAGSAISFLLTNFVLGMLLGYEYSDFVSHVC